MQNVYVADFGNGLIEKIDSESGQLRAVAGGGSMVPSMTPTPAADAEIAGPYGVTVDGAANLYIADTGNNLIDKIDAASGKIMAVAGGGSVASSTNSQPATSAALQEPIDLAVDGRGNVYIVEFGSGLVDKIEASTVVSFPSLLIGETSASQEARIENIGNDTLTISGLSDPPDYPLQNGGSCTAAGGIGQSLASGDSCTLTYSFRPTGIGSLDEAATITDDSLNVTNAQQAISFVGTSLSIATNLTVVASPTQTTSGTSVALSATVQSGQGIPTGTVMFSTGAAVLGSAALDASGVARVNTTTLPVGTDTVTASYAANADYVASTGTVSVTVLAPSPIATNLTVTASPTQATSGSSVLLSVVVQAGQGIPTGTVTFSTATTVLGSANLNATGLATVSTTNLPVGTNTVTASYAANADYSASTGTVSVTVLAPSPIATNLTVTASPTQVTSGSSVLLSAVVQSGQGIPMGTVTFSTGATVLGSATLDASGVARVNTTALPDGTDMVTASYAASAEYAASLETIEVTVLPSSSYTVAINPTSLTLVQGQSGNSAFTITPSLGYSGALDLQCLNLPSNALCVFTLNTVPVKTISLSGDDKPININLTVATYGAELRGPSLMTPVSPSSDFIPVAFLLWLPGGIAGLAWCQERRRRFTKSRMIRNLTSILIAGSVLFITLGCAGGSPSQAASSPSQDTFALMVAAEPATIGSVPSPSHEATLMITVLH